MRHNKKTGTAYYILLLLTFQSFYISGQSLFESALNDSPDAAGGTSYLHSEIRSFSYTGYDTETDRPVLQALYGQFNLVADVPAGSFGQAYAEIRFRSGTEYGQRIQEISLREAWVLIYLGSLELSVGKQIHNWGASTFVNPSDRFSPMNPVLRSPDPDDLRLGVWTMKVDLAITSTSSLELMWMPDYRPSVLLTEPFDLPQYIRMPPYPDHQLVFSDGGFGVRYDLRSSVLDMQLSWFNGFRNNPALAIDTAVFDQSTFAPELIRIKQEPVRINSLGFNLTVPLERSLVRTEIGWTDPVNDSVTGGMLHELGYTLEIEQSRENVSVIAGYYGKYIHNFRPVDTDPSLLAGELPELSGLFPPGSAPDLQVLQDYFRTQVNGFNRIYDYQQQKFMHAAYVILDLKFFNNMVGFEIPCMYNFTAKELTLMPSVEFSFTDGLSGRMGAYYLCGEDKSLFDLVSSSMNALFLGLEMKF